MQDGSHVLELDGGVHPCEPHGCIRFCAELPKGQLSVGFTPQDGELEGLHGGAYRIHEASAVIRWR